MKLINQQHIIYNYDFTKDPLINISEQIELAGRTCYKSTRPEGKTAEDFVKMLVKNKHCYTGSSMVLTEEGWIPWNAYNGEKVAVVDTNGYFIGFETPQRVIKHSYTGNFYYYPSLGIEVTDGHRMYGLFRESKNDFYNSTVYDTFVCGQPYKDNNGRQKTLGERMFKVPKHCTRPIHTDPFYELVGFWLGDGCYQPQTVNKLVFHLKKERKIRYLESLCKELGYTFEVSKSNYYKVCSPKIGAKFNQLFYHEGKYIPNMYKAEDAVAIKSIILGLINSDGSKGVNTKTITFTSTSLAIIQWLNNVATIGGFTVSFRGICHETPVHNSIYKIFLLDTDYTINNDSRNSDTRVRITNKTEDVYCVTVSTGLILVKGDNGVTSICGNCAMLEHGTVYLYKESDKISLDKYFYNKYSRYYVIINDGKVCEYVTTNLRVLKENDWEGDLKYVCHPTKYHAIRKTVRFICSRAIAQELTRHRVFSFAMESQRYCNYSADKFDNEVTYIIPSFFKEDPNNLEFLYSSDECSSAETIFIMSCVKNESHYFELLKTLPPEHARSVLNNSCKTELVMTGFEDDWKYLFSLRSSEASTGKPHPDMVKLIDNLILDF